MEEDFSLLKLLQSGQEGINELQSTIDGSGITIDCPRSNFYYLDFGVTANDELKYETDIPLGYEESITEQDKKIVAKTLKLTSAFPYTIRRIDVLPSNNEKLPEISVLVDDEDILLSHKALNLKPHQELELKVLCKVNPGYFGFLGRWIIFLFERKWKPSMTKCQVESFVFGIRLQGCVTRDKSSRIQLSSEARAFIPQASIIYFEEQVHTSSYKLIIIIIIRYYYITFMHTLFI